jgi:hypothetical protein
MTKVISKSFDLHVASRSWLHKKDQYQRMSECPLIPFIVSHTSSSTWQDSKGLLAEPNPSHKFCIGAKRSRIRILKHLHHEGLHFVSRAVSLRVVGSIVRSQQLWHAKSLYSKTYSCFNSTQLSPVRGVRRLGTSSPSRPRNARGASARAGFSSSLDVKG